MIYTFKVLKILLDIYLTLQWSRFLKNNFQAATLLVKMALFAE
jgi:hypothetical protein